MYGLAGERNLPRRFCTHLPVTGMRCPCASATVPVDQYQADVVGEVDGRPWRSFGCHG
jgi:hypothetical protein